jgi:hypothetical protein
MQRPPSSPVAAALAAHDHRDRRSETSAMNLGLLAKKPSRRAPDFADPADRAHACRSLTLRRQQTYPRNRSGVSLHAYGCDSTDLGCRRY